MSEIKGTLEEVRRSTGHLCFEWRIEGFSSLVHLDYFHSPRISFNNASWRMDLLPNREWLDLRFFRCNAGPPATMKVAFCVRGSWREEHKIEWKGESPGFFGFRVWHRDSAPKMADLRRRLLQEGGALVLRCEMETDDGDEPVQTNEESSESSDEEGVEELLKSLGDMLRSGEDSDVILEVRGKEFRAHRSILRARSPVFRAMFAHEMLERQRNAVVIEDCDPESFPAFLEHLYTGGVGMVSTSNVCALYAASDKYDLKALKSACAKFASRNLSVASFCDVIALAVRHGERELTDRATEFYCNNALDIVRTPEWQIFMAENPTVANELYIRQLSI